jgi:hypothetical protein
MYPGTRSSKNRSFTAVGRVAGFLANNREAWVVSDVVVSADPEQITRWCLDAAQPTEEPLLVAFENYGTKGTQAFALGFSQLSRWTS